jgi:hypothetical protein
MVSEYGAAPAVVAAQIGQPTHFSALSACHTSR